MESALARSAGCRTGDCAVALVAFVATHSQGRHHCGAGWRNADGCHVGQGAGTNGQRSSSVAGGRRVVAYADHRARCSGIRAVKCRAEPPDADLIPAIGNEQTRRRAPASPPCRRFEPPDVTETTARKATNPPPAAAATSPVPPANPTPATATATTARINNDDLGLHCQVIDLEVISLGDGQWHGIRDFRRDSPTDRPDAGNSNDGTRQDIREHRTATYCSHEFSPLSECFFRALQKPQHLSGEVAWLFATLQVIQHLLYRGASNLRSSKFKSPCRSIGVFIRASQGFFLSTRAQDIGIIWQVAFRRFLIAVPVSTPSCGLIADDSGTRRAVSLSVRSVISRLVLLANQHVRIPGRSFRRGNCASAAAFSGRRIDMQHRSEGRTGPWLAAGYAMCFRCERNGTTIRLQRHDQAPWRRYWRDKRGNAILGCFCAKQPDRPRHAKRKLRRCQRQRCPRPGSGRQGADRRIPPHDNVAAVVGRRPDRT